MKPVIYSANSFPMGMTPKVYSDNGATRIEHFDTITEVLRPFRTLIASTNNQTVATTALQLINFELLNDSIYAVGVDWATPTWLAIYKWNTSAFEWQDKMSASATSLANPMLQAHAGFLFGLRDSRFLYKMTTGAVYTASFYDCTAFSYFCDAIVHSKDGVMYWATDNKIHKVESTGTTGSLALTLPNANFRVTSICEQGNYMNIVGYDLKTGESASLLWDRDTSVIDLTETYQLGREFAYHNASILGQTFFVQLRQNSSNTSFEEKPVIVIKYLNGQVPVTINEFPVESFTVTSGAIGSKYTSNDRIYFTGLVKLLGESTARNIVFCLDYKGRLTIAQNASLNTGTSLVTGILRNGEGFWLGAGSDGAWNTASSYTTVASYDTTDIRADDLTDNISFVGATIACEPLPSGAQIVLKARKNEETAFTTLETFTTQNAMKFSTNIRKAVDALNGIANCKQIRLRLESTGGAVITAFQAEFIPIKNENYG